MTYVVEPPVLNANTWIALKFAPSTAFMRENMLVIHPDECIDCGVCEPECPVEAISDDSDESSKNGSKLTENIQKFGQTLIKLVHHLTIVMTGKMYLINLKSISAKSLEKDLK